MSVLLFIKFRSIAGMLLQYFTRREFLLGFRQPFQFFDDFLQPKMFSETQRSAAERRETGSQNHSVIEVLRRVDDFLFHAGRGLVHHQKDKPVRQLFFVQAQARVAVPVWRDIWAFGAFGLTMQAAPP